MLCVEQWNAVFNDIWMLKTDQLYVGTCIKVIHKVIGFECKTVNKK